MKTTFKFIALSLILSMSTVALAGKADKNAVSAELKVRIASLDDAKVLVRFTKLEDELVKVKIFDANGTMVYSDKLTSGATYAKSFNMSALPAGKYTYKVSNSVYGVTKVIDIK